MSGNVLVVGNRDRCGRCGARHGGNNHHCSVHGAVSAGCCESRCLSGDWVWIATRDPRYPSLSGVGKRVLRESVDLSDYTREKPYSFQDDGGGNYRDGHIERCWRWDEKVELGLTALAELSGIQRNTLYQAALAGRLETTNKRPYLSTLEMVGRYRENLVLEPRK